MKNFNFTEAQTEIISILRSNNGLSTKDIINKASDIFTEDLLRKELLCLRSLKSIQSLGETWQRKWYITSPENITT
tara:strand:- start:350 stop:577 length:228 start_codon:yes stop_codon:yes gene_type:complete